MQKFKVNGQSVPKIEWKQTDRQTDGQIDGRTDGLSRFHYGTSHANAVGKNSQPFGKYIQKSSGDNVLSHTACFTVNEQVQVV